MKRSWLKAVLLLIPLLAGCRNPQSPEVYLSPGIPFRLCAPKAGPDMFITQEVVFHFPGGAEETAIAVLENRDGHFSVVASSPLGQTLFIVRLEGAECSVDSRIPIPGDLDPRVLPALVQFSMWPAEAVRQGLGPEVAFQEEGQVRRLVRKGKPVWVVTRTGGEPPRGLLLENPALHLTAHIRTLDD